MSQERTNESGLIGTNSSYIHIFSLIGNFSYFDKMNPDTSAAIQVLPTQSDCDTYLSNLEIASENAIATMTNEVVK